MADVGFQNSYWKTLTLAAGGALVLGASGIFALHLPAPISLLAIVLLIAAAAAGLVAIGGLIVLRRTALLARAEVDWFNSANERRSERALSREIDFGLRVRRWLRIIFARRSLVVGDTVRVRGLDEIERTLDANGMLDELPFMPEMARYCGRRLQVFRRLDKAYDYGGAKVVRRLKGAVLLTHVRCDGGMHGGCEAACYLIWKEAWLERVPDAAAADAALRPSDEDREIRARLGQRYPTSRVDASGKAQYRCQFTQLVRATTPLHPMDFRQDLRPLASGNLTILGFLVGVLTRLFNFTQALRGGSGFPFMPGASPSAQGPAQPKAPLKAGDVVVVASAGEIRSTLDGKNKNRGLWFDRDMIKHCGREYHVLRRVERIIDDATGHMLVMKTPCFVLRDVNYSGEFLRFCAQEENLYWREAWFKRTPSEPVAESSSLPSAPIAVTKGSSR